MKALIVERSPRVDDRSFHPSVAGRVGFGNEAEVSLKRFTPG
jgi:hypothetical protein